MQFLPKFSGWSLCREADQKKHPRWFPLHNRRNLKSSNINLLRQLHPTQQLIHSSWRWSDQIKQNKRVSTRNGQTRMVNKKQSQALVMNPWSSHHWSGSRRRCNFQSDPSMVNQEPSPHPLNPYRRQSNHRQQIKSPQTQQEQTRDRTRLGGRTSRISWEWFRRLKLVVRN